MCERGVLYSNTTLYEWWSVLYLLVMSVRTQASDVQGSFDRQRSDLIKLAADGSVEYLPVPEPQEPLPPHYGAAGNQSSTPRVFAQEPTHENMALTADNLHQIPDAEQLAPGIRLPENVVSDSANVVPAPAESTLSMEPTPPMTTVPDTNIPAELDPRTEAFRPGVPRAGSVFSVAVQPGSPKVDKVPPRTIESPTPDSSVSSRAATPTFSVGHTSSSLSKLRSNTDTSTVSFAPSEAGSTTSDMSSSNYSTDVREQELAIDRQRMLERAMSGGELGIGGPIPAPFMRNRDDPTSMGIQPPPRTNSAAATVASSPSTSTRGSGSVSASRESSRRGSLDSVEFSVPRDAVAP